VTKEEAKTGLLETKGIAAVRWLRHMELWFMNGVLLLLAYVELEKAAATAVTQWRRHKDNDREDHNDKCDSGGGGHANNHNTMVTTTDDLAMSRAHKHLCVRVDCMEKLITSCGRPAENPNLYACRFARELCLIRSARLDRRGLVRFLSRCSSTCANNETR
jgi:hypothetical protein